MFMNSPWWKATGLAAVLVVGLIVSFASGQTRPGTTTPAAPASDARGRLAAKVAELSKRIEVQVEATRLQAKAAAALAMLEDGADAGDVPASKLEVAVPSLKNDRYVLHQYDNELDDMASRLGSANPKYKAMATRVEAMRKAYQKNLAAATGQYTLALTEARQEAAVAKRSLDEATAKVETAKRELIDLAVAGGR